MNILLISDTHGDTTCIKRVLSRHLNIDYLWHLGDSCVAPHELEGFISVKGNCDFYQYPKMLDLNFHNFNIRLIHGDKIYIPYKQYMEENNINILLTGHTHVAIIEKYKDNMIHINPGSLYRPRDNNYGSYVILTIEDNKIDAKIYRLED